MNPPKVYQKIAYAIYAIEKGKQPTKEFYLNRIDEIMNTAPHGSGIDDDIVLNRKSTERCLIFDIPFHFMNMNGFYERWYDFKAKVTPCLMFGFDLKITGRDPNGIKDYLYDVINDWLESPYSG